MSYGISQFIWFLPDGYCMQIDNTVNTFRSCFLELDKILQGTEIVGNGQLSAGLNS